MIISNEVKGNSLVGEATLNLIFNREKVTLHALLLQLDLMAENEADGDKARAINEVRRGLQGFFIADSYAAEKEHWLETAYPDGAENNNLPPIQLFSPSKTDD